MSRYRVTPRALRDIDAIADYTLATWGERQTEKYLAELQLRFAWLAEHPYAGRTRDEIEAGFRSYPQSQYIIFYLIDTNGIVIIGVPHGSMDIEAFFNDPE